MPHEKVQCQGASTDEIPTGDLETAKLYAQRVKAIVEKLHG